jgi:iron complex outermembrane receptor protein
MFKRTKLSASVLLAFGGAIASTAAVAQQALERVEITGSAIRRVQSEGALPVQVIKIEDLAAQGVTNAEQALARVASNQGSFGVSQSIGATTGGKAEADLRGLGGPTGSGGNKTLVLLNGRRLANHAFDAQAVDLNAIPLSAIDRIEVLRDGASSLYGSDAIGGVINFIVRRDYQGLEASVQRQNVRKKGGDTTRLSLTGGFGSLANDGFNVLASLDVRKQDVVEAAWRGFADTGIVAGAITAGTSGSSFPGDLNGFEPSLGAGCAPPSSIPNEAGTACRYDFTRDIDIVPENEQKTLLLRGSVAIGQDNKASLEYLRAQNDVISRVAPAPVSHLMPASSPFFPAGAPLTAGGIPDLNSADPDATVPGGVVNWRQVPAGKRTSGDDTKTERLMFELDGLVAGWDYRSAVGVTENTSIASVKRGYVNDGLMQQGVFDGVINPFGDQTADGLAAIEAAQVLANTVIGKNKATFVDVSMSRTLVDTESGPIALAVGVEYRKEKSAFENTDITAQLGSLGVDPDGDTAGERNTRAVYAELSVPLTKKLELGFSGRYDRYSDFGSTLNPKISMRYQPTRELLLRGSANTGFRAPSLYDVYQPRSLTFTADNYDDPLLCPGGNAVIPGTDGVVCGQQVLQRLSGPAAIGQPASALQPEKSKSLTFGFVFEPIPSVSLGIDLWRVEVDNLISALPEQAVFGDPTKYASRFRRCSQVSAAERAQVDSCLNFPGYDPIAYIDVPTENLGQLTTRGVDLSAQWRPAPTSVGSFSVSIDGTYVDSFKYQREAGGEFISAAGRYADNTPVFRWQHTLTVGWKLGAWAATLGQRYKSGYTDQDGVNDVDSYTLYDASVTWTGVKNLTVAAGINNLLDEEPPVSGQTNTFQRGYDPRFTDPLGRTLMLRLAYKFF